MGLPRFVARLGCRGQVRWFGVIGIFGLLLIGPYWLIAQATRPADAQPANSLALGQQYQAKFERLAPDDIQGHYALAEWCRDNKLFQQLLKQSQYVLRLDPANENARLLYRLASTQIRAQLARSRPAPGEPVPETTDGEFLTHTQIQMLKWAEFLDADSPTSPVGTGRRRGSRSPGGLTEEYLRVRYDGKVLDEFFDLMAGNPDFSSREDRARLTRLPATRQVQLIRHYTGNRFEPRVEILNDPLVFRQFDRIQPIVTSACGSMSCHGGPDAHVWRLRTARTRPEPNLYTNFLILNRVRRGNARMVNRGKPEESLLLQYGLPPIQAQRIHPVSIPVLFPRGRDDARYQSVLNWIQTLRVPEPRTGVTLPGYPEPPPPQFGGSPSDKNQSSQPAGASGSAPAAGGP